MLTCLLFCYLLCFIQDVWWHHSPIKPHPDLAARLGALQANVMEDENTSGAHTGSAAAASVPFNGTLDTTMSVDEARALPMVACPMLAFIPSSPEYAGVHVCMRFGVL